MTEAEKTAGTSDAGALERENEELRARVRDLEETLDAIRRGEVDAIVVSTGGQRRVYSLEGVNYPYRALVERIQEGALTVNGEGMILYANAAFARMRQRPLSTILGSALADHIAPRDRARFDALLRSSRSAPQRCDLSLCGGSASFPVHLSLTPIEAEDRTTISVVITDRREDYGRLRLQGRMLDSVVDAVTAVDPGGTIIYWNGAAERLYGWTADERVGITVDEAFDPATPGKDARRFSEQLLAGEAWSGEQVARHRDGHRFPVQASRAPVYDEDGTLVAVIGTSHDISERKAAEAALRESEERFRLALRNAPTAVFHQDADLRYTWYSNPHPPFSDTSLLGMTDADLMAPEDAAPITALKREVLATGESCRGEVSVTAGGATTYYDLAVEPERDADGRTVGVMGVSHDITELKVVEAALRRSEEEYREIVVYAPTAIFEIDYAGPRFRRVNDAMCEILGYTRDELLAMDPGELMDGESSERFRERVRTILAGEPVDESVAYRLFAKDGREIWGALNIKPTFTDGVMDGALVVAHDITGRRRMELALQASEERYRELVEQAGSIILRYDTEGRITFANEFAERFFGFAPGELPGRPAVGTIIPETESTGRDLAAMVREIVREPERYLENENENLKRNGERVWIRWSNRPVLNPDGSVREFLAVGMDITLRKRAEEARQQSEARQALLAGVASRLLSTEEPQAVVDEIGQRALAVLDCDVFFNYLSDEASGRLRLNAYGGVPAEEADRIRHLDCGAAVCGCVARDGCRIVAEAIPDHPDPRTDLVAAYGVRAYACHPLMVGGRAIGTLSFGTCSRDRFAPEELAAMQALADLIAVAMQRIADRDALRESEKRYRSVIENSRDVVYRRNLGTEQYEYISPSCEAILGFTADELMALDTEGFISMVHPDERAALRAMIEETDRVGHGEVEYRQQAKDGTYRWVSNRMSLVRDDAGLPLMHIGTVRDITRRKDTELDMARYADRLQRSNEELQRFAYVASHDLQEPLRSIVSFSQLLERRYKGRLDQDADDYIGFIVEGGNRMQTLIRDLLQVSRIETMAKPPVPTDPDRVVRDALALFNGQIAATGGSVIVEPMPTVMADPAQLEQVFANLIGNAIKYRRPEVPPEIRISARPLNPVVEFAVQDNGIGIEPEYYDRIFEMFRRLHTHDQYEGTGIGLAVVKRIIERHGGTIRVESTPGEGSTFFFTLPAA